MIFKAEMESMENFVLSMVNALYPGELPLCRVSAMVHDNRQVVNLEGIHLKEGMAYNVHGDWNGENNTISMNRRGTMKRISELPFDERPREKMVAHGAASLNNAELLAILLRTGVEGQSAVALGANLLEEFHGIAGIHAAEIDELCMLNGVGQAKATQLKAALELGSRLHQESMDERPVIDSPEKAYEVLKFEIIQNDRETLWVLALNTRHRLIKKKKLYQGTRNFSSVRVAEIFEFAILQHASAIILAHNHPSGEALPSQEDLRITQEIRKAGELLEITLLDHLIIVPGQYRSLKKEQHGIFEEDSIYK